MKALIRVAAAAILAGLPQRAAAQTIEDFWPTLWTNYCSKASLAAHPTRTGSCSAAAPANSSAAASQLLAVLDDTVVQSVWVSQQTTKLVQLKQQSMDSLVGLLAPANDVAAGPQGSPVQSDAVPGAQPVAQTGVNAGIAGTQSGIRLVASIAINPAGLLTTSASTTDSAAQKAGTLASRIADLSVVLPIDPSGSAKPPGVLGSFSYVGVRLRVNAMPLLQDDLYEQARTKTDDLFAKALAAEGSASDQIAALVAAFDSSGCALAVAIGGPKPAQCAAAQPAGFVAQITSASRCLDAIESAVGNQIAALCGSPIPQLDVERSTEKELRQALDFRRDQHDADVVGLDVRYDYGDPTFSGDPSARGNYVLAALAAGHRFLGGSPTSARDPFFGLRARIGWSYSSNPQSGVTANSVDYAGGLELGAISNLNVLKLSAGVEGRRRLRLSRQRWTRISLMQN